ncbi:MAG: type II secretion system protein, partial [Myxococcales bacterium]|nr:type II secretion system protein [Myxococcales bacterium]
MMRARRRRGGFTLIELAAVVLVISLLYGFVLPNIGIGRRRALDGEAEGLRAGLELARQRSIATGARHRVALDLDGSRYHLERFEIPPPAPPSERDPR